MLILVFYRYNDCVTCIADGSYANQLHAMRQNAQGTLAEQRELLARCRQDEGLLQRQLAEASRRYAG